MPKLMLSAFADEYADDFESQLHMLVQKGIPYVELRNIHGQEISGIPLFEVKEMSRALRESGIGLSAIGSPLGKISVEDDFAAHVEKARRIFERAAILGAKNIRIFSFYYPAGEKEKVRNQVFDRLGKLLQVSEPYGLTLCHENEAKIYGESPESCLEIAEYFDNRIKCVFDMGNFVLDGYHPMQAYERVKSHIAYFHIKDALSAGAVVPPGKGEAMIADILQAYMTQGAKDTYVTLEPHLQTFGGRNQLVGRTFANPYQYDSRESAFFDALDHIRTILGGIP